MTDGTAPASDALAALETAVEHAQKALTDSLWQVPEADLPAVLDRVHTLTARHTSLTLAVLREVDSRGIPATVGAKTLKTYLAQRLRPAP